MPDIDRIIEQLLGDRRISEGATFSTRTYADQPIIERGSDLKARMERREAERAERRQREAEARQATRARSRRHHEARTSSRGPLSELLDELGLNPFGQITSALNSANLAPVPDAIKRMRALENGGLPSTMTYGSSTAASLFRRQAEMMVDYEDDYDFQGTFSQYYPTYAAMSNHQLRGYFSWRTRVRAGLVQPAPLSFAFVYVYELLMSIGVEPGIAGYEALRDFGIAYRDADELQGGQLAAYLNRWLRDYAIYHQIPEVLPQDTTAEAGACVLTLLRAENAVLAAHGRKPHIPHPLAEGARPSDEELFRAMSSLSTYHASDARLAKTDPELVSSVTASVFEQLVLHCSKRRKTDFVEGLFGYACNVPYTMFSAAVFSEAESHPDCTVRLSDYETYTCANGRWKRLLACEKTTRNADLGLALHSVDRILREQTDYPYPLKERKAPKYLLKMVTDAAAAYLAQRAEAEKRRITIDRSKLRDIRAAAAVTQEALLTEEERGEVAPVVEPLPANPQPAVVPPVAEAPAPAAPTLAEVPTAPVAAPAPAPAPTPAADLPYDLTELEARFLAGLLAGTPASELLGPTDPFVSVVADSINEKLFDLVGDAVIEFDGDKPQVIEDYLQDVQEVLQP